MPGAADVFHLRRPLVYISSPCVNALKWPKGINMNNNVDACWRAYLFVWARLYLSALWVPGYGIMCGFFVQRVCMYVSL